MVNNPPVPEVGGPAVGEGHPVVLDDGPGKGPGLHPHQVKYNPVKLVIVLPETNNIIYFHSFSLLLEHTDKKIKQNFPLI
jgi:hypothetical protein